MKKVLWLMIVLLLNVTISESQTLFTYGNKAVSKQAFLVAFN